MKKWLSIVYKLLTAAASVVGIIMCVGSSGSAMLMLSYYTNQSNLICAVVFIFIAVLLILGKDPQSKRWYPIVKGAVTMCILVTFLVYHFMLAPTMFEMGGDDFSQNLFNILLHYVAPLMVFFDYIIFDRKGAYRFTHPFVWMFIPLLYPVYVVVYNLCGGRFLSIGGATARAPYFFLDVDTIGWWGVAKWVVFIIIAYLILSFLLVAADMLMGKIAAKKSK